MNRVTKAAALGLALSCAIAAPSWAQSFDFSGAEDIGNDLLSWMRGNLANIILTVALVVTGFLAAFNRIPWAWFWAVFFGAFIIFSAPKLVTWMSGAFN
jgi:type IV secretory pathway VirB2 component (pilin)